MSSALFSSYRLRGVTLPNRTVVSPMCEYSAVDGNAQDWHLMHLGQFATSGIGLVITEAAAVEPRGRITRECLGLWCDENEAALERVIRFCREFGQARLGIQLAHAGRKASTHRPWEGRDPLRADQGAWETVSSSPNPHTEGWHTPRSMDRAEMEVVKQAFVDATRRAARIGFDLVEVHGAHGYLLHEFLSPIANTRNDEYGGTLENRMRYPLEVFAAMREVWPEDKVMGLRVSATDWAEHGWTPEDACEFARRLKSLGCDYICASSGGITEAQKIELGEGYQVRFAAQIRRETEMPTMAVGMIYDPHHAERIVSSGEADMVALARGLLFDPHWAQRAAAALDAETASPPQYERAYNFRFLREKEKAWARPAPDRLEA
ncbi:MAG: NADH:flavin oxidoreductase/NADH oxidase [Gammaproteobacteria bacterium]|nr:NADH:flavin oxidoreductase/NADH oxidase [Gammaproteobacteria bacterium]